MTAQPRPGEYEGWTNYATWNVFLWVTNDEPLYRFAVAAARQGKSWAQFAAALRELGLGRTIDGIAVDDPTLDLEELDAALLELAGTATCGICGEDLAEGDTGEFVRAGQHVVAHAECGIAEGLALA